MPVTHTVSVGKVEFIEGHTGSYYRIRGFWTEEAFRAAVEKAFSKEASLSFDSIQHTHHSTRQGVIEENLSGFPVTCGWVTSCEDVKG